MDDSLYELAKSSDYSMLSKKDKADMRDKLGFSLGDWIPKGGYVSLSAFNEYVNSNYVTLPFSGGWLDQPQWVIDDFNLFRRVMNFHKLNEDLARGDNV